jgi:hypothetical protein
VDQVSQQSDAAAGEKDRELHGGGHRQHRQGEADRPKPLPRAFDAGVDVAVGMTMSAVVVMVMGVRMRLAGVDVRAAVGMLMDEAGAVTMAVAAQRFVGEEPFGHRRQG